MISDHPIIKKIAWTSGTRRAGASMETHREYVGYLDEWDGAERLTNEEIVRCRDCKYAEPDDSGRSYYKDMLWCSELGGDDSMPVEYDGFCAWGERRGD